MAVERADQEGGRVARVADRQQDRYSWRLQGTWHSVNKGDVLERRERPEPAAGRRFVEDRVVAQSLRQQPPQPKQLEALFGHSTGQPHVELGARRHANGDHPAFDLAS